MDYKQPTYINSLTPLRGIAALWVVLFHIDVSIYYRDLGALLPRETTGIFSKGYLWVDFFFLLSGFIITHVYGEMLSNGLTVKKVRAFLWARFSRLYPLHLFTTLVLVVGVMIIPTFTPNIMDGSWGSFFNWDILPAHFLMINAMTNYHALSWNITSWSIGAEWWTYVLAIFLIPLILNRRRVLVILFGLIAFSCLAGLVYWHPVQNLDITWDFGFFRCLFEFSVGIVIYRGFQKRVLSRWLSRDLLTVILFMLTAIVFHFKFPDLIVIPIFSLLILCISYNHNRVMKVLEKPVFKYLGDISYSIYLVHSLWFMVFWFCLPQIRKYFDLDILPWPWRIVYVCVFLMLTIVSSHFTYHYIEVKAREMLRQTSRIVPT